MEILTEEHKDWVDKLREAEEKGEGVDINLGGNFAGRVQKMLYAFATFKERHKTKKGIFG